MGCSSTNPCKGKDMRAASKVFTEIYSLLKLSTCDYQVVLSKLANKKFLTSSEFYELTVEIGYPRNWKIETNNIFFAFGDFMEKDSNFSTGIIRLIFALSQIDKIGLNLTIEAYMNGQETISKSDISMLIEGVCKFATKYMGLAYNVSVLEKKLLHLSESYNMCHEQTLTPIFQTLNTIVIPVDVTNMLTKFPFLNGIETIRTEFINARKTLKKQNKIQAK